LVSNMLKRVAAKKELFQHKDGALKLLGIYGRLIPILSLVLIVRLFEENFGRKKTGDLLYLVGETQSYNATMWTVNKVGIHVKGNEQKIFNETIGHSEVSGLGKPKTLRFDMKNKVIVAAMQNNTFNRQYMNLFGMEKECMDHYVRGLFGGAAKFLFGEDVVVTSKSIPAEQKEVYTIIIRKGCEEDVRKFIPDESLKTDALKEFDIRKLIA
jgi:hypothetical protein